MKNVAVFFDDPGENDYPFNIELYRTVYRQLAQVMESIGGKLCVVRGRETYLGSNDFSHAWIFDGDFFKRAPGPFHADVVWNKGRQLQDAQLLQVNHPELDAICLDKWRCYRLFPHLFRKTLLVNSEAELPGALASLATDTVTLKPLSGWGGFNVIIGAREEVIQKNKQYPCIVQEFIDTAQGIDGLVDGMHDFRIVSLNGEVGLSYIRTPPPGMFTANVSQGGREIEVPPDAVPPEPHRILAEVDRAFSTYTPRIYTVDMGRDRDGRWYVFEINAKPGFSPMETGSSYPPFYRKLCSLLLDAAAQGSAQASTADPLHSPLRAAPLRT